MSKRKQYSPEFKREAVELARRSGTSCRQIAQEIGVAPSLLNRWVREARAAEKPFPGTGNPRDEELARLKRELARVMKERDFLKDAAVGSTGQCYILRPSKRWTSTYDRHQVARTFSSAETRTLE